MESGFCSVHQKHVGNLCKKPLSDGVSRICLNCFTKMYHSDIRASDRNGIRLDMAEVGIPLRGFQSNPAFIQQRF